LFYPTNFQLFLSFQDDKPKKKRHSEADVSPRQQDASKSEKASGKLQPQTQKFGKKTSLPAASHDDKDSLLNLKLMLKKTPKAQKQDEGALAGVKLKPVIRSDDLSEASGSDLDSSRRDSISLNPSLRRVGESRAEAARRSSVDMRRESVQEIMSRVVTPLIPSGEKGKPPRIMEVPENVTVVESKPFIIFSEDELFLPI
ncbi:hypothetical protein COOONC_03841, partial [Cooperia oncophora]